MRESILSRSSGDGFGLQNCSVTEPVIHTPPHTLLVSRSCANNLWSYVCNWEECICACVFIVPKNLAQVGGNCLHWESVLKDIVYQEHLFLLNYLNVYFTLLKSLVATPTPQVFSKLALSLEDRKKADSNFS